MCFNDQQIAMNTCLAVQDVHFKMMRHIRWLNTELSGNILFFVCLCIMISRMKNEGCMLALYRPIHNGSLMESETI